MKKHPSIVDRDISRRVKQRRIELGLNQKLLARELGISYQQVQKYENGTDRISAGRLLAISDALQCDVSEFFGSASAAGDATRKLPASMQRILSTADGRLLVHAFMQIDDTLVRQRLVDLVAALAAAMRRSNGGERTGHPFPPESESGRRRAIS